MASLAKTVVVAGVGPGIGLAAAKAFHAEGYHLALVARKAEYLESVRQELGPNSCSAFPCDLSSEEQVKEVFSRIQETCPPVDALIYNAGASFSPGPFLKMKASDIESSFQVQTLGLVRTSQALLPGMLSRKSGSIIVTGATASMRGSANFANLAAPKFATKAVAQSLAREFGPQGIHVSHVILDGVVESEKGRMWKKDAGPDDLIQPSAVASNFLMLHKQSRSTWTFELELRPAAEKW